MYYITPLQELFHMNATDDDNKLDYSNTVTDNLQEVRMTFSFTMKKRFPIKWRNQVFSKFLLINVKLPNVLIRHIMDGTLNSKLITNYHLSMNNTTLQVLARATPRFNIHFGIKSSSFDSIWLANES